MNIREDNRHKQTKLNKQYNLDSLKMLFASPVLWFKI